MAFPRKRPENGLLFTWPRAPTKSCKSRGSHLRIHFKNTLGNRSGRQRCRKATTCLKAGTLQRQCVPSLAPMAELAGEPRPPSGAGHTVSVTQRECWKMHRLLSAENAAELKCLDVDSLVMEHVQEDKAPRMPPRTSCTQVQGSWSD